ncbi:MAG: hypothetical protein ACYTG5_13195 [Planctomycetota bacterium]|jgi:hypothetical protein
MTWSDREWDDYVRGQPMTFWGEEKNRLTRQTQIPQSSDQSVRGGQGSGAGAGGRSIEDTLKLWITLGTGVAAGYLCYQVETAAWLGITLTIAAMVLIGWCLSTERGDRFVELLSKILGWILVLSVIGAFVFVLIALIAGASQG